MCPPGVIGVFYLSKSLKVKGNAEIRKPTYGKYEYPFYFLVLAIPNIHDIEFDLSRSLKVKVNGATIKPICDFLLVNNSKYVPICSIL